MNSSSISSSDPAIGATWRKLGAFSAGTVVLLCLLHLLGGFRRDNRDVWLGPWLDGRGFDVLFVGTSRVAAAIDTAAFGRTMSDSGFPGIRAANLGMGYTTMSEYVIGLRELVRRRPEALKGKTVFLEAPMGLPEFTTWNDDWIVPQGIDPLAAYLPAAKLPDFWRSSPTDWFEKTLVSARVLFGYRENFSRLRYNIDSRLIRWLDPVRPQEGKSADLTAAAGIRTDSVGVKVVRDAALSVAASQMKSQKPWRGYDHSILKELVDFIQSSGGRVRIYEMPLSSIQAGPYLTPLRREDRALFAKDLQSWKLDLLHPEFPTTDDDFPDLWHLRKGRSAAFTEALAKAYIADSRR